MGWQFRIFLLENGRSCTLSEHALAPGDGVRSVWQSGPAKRGSSLHFRAGKNLRVPADGSRCRQVASSCLFKALPLERPDRVSALQLPVFPVVIGSVLGGLLLAFQEETGSQTVQRHLPVTMLGAFIG